MKRTITAMLLVAGLSWSALPTFADGGVSVSPSVGEVTITNGTNEPVYMQVYDSLSAVKAGQARTFDLDNPTLEVDGVVHWAVWTESGALEASGTYELESAEETDVVGSIDLISDPKPPVRAIRFMFGGRHAE